jgi:hypothetical protein
MPDAVWVAHEWLGEVVITWLFDHFGWIGLLTATGLSAAAAVAMLLRVLLRTLAPVHAMIATALSSALWHCAHGLKPRWTWCSPH